MSGRAWSLPSRNDWLFIAGMACYWPAFRNSFFGLIFADAGSGGAPFDSDYLLFLGCMAVLCVGCLVYPRVIHQLLHADRWAVAALSLLGSGGLALVYTARTCLLNNALVLGGILCAATAFLSLTFAWFNECIRTRKRNVLFYLALSFFLSFILSLTSLLPIPASLALPFCSWIISGTAYALFQPARAAECPERIGSVAALRGAASGLVILLVAFLVIGALIRGFLYSGTVSYSPDQGTYSRRILSLALSLIIVIIAYRADAGKPPLFGLWAFVSTVFFGGLFLVGALYSIMPELSSGVVISGRTFVTLFLWVALMISMRQKRLSLVPVVGTLFVLVECISGFCSYFAAPAIARALQIPASAFLPPFALLMAFILIASTLAFLALAVDRGAGNMQVDGQEPYRPETHKGKLKSASEFRSREVACADLGARHGLTEREIEVMISFSQGNSLRKVADSLFISMSTAQTHVKSLYRKLGIHSKQELIDLVAEAMEKPVPNA